MGSLNRDCFNCVRFLFRCLLLVFKSRFWFCVSFSPRFYSGILLTFFFTKGLFWRRQSQWIPFAFLDGELNRLLAKAFFFLPMLGNIAGHLQWVVFAKAKTLIACEKGKNMPKASTGWFLRCVCNYFVMCNRRWKKKSAWVSQPATGKCHSIAM